MLGMFNPFYGDNAGQESKDFATSISMVTDSQTRIVTTELKNKDGQTLGQPQTIQLPEEVGKTSVKGTEYVIDGVTYTVGDNAEYFNSYSNNKAIGNYSHTEGFSTTAIGYSAHAEGIGTQAKGMYSHAEGSSSKANGQVSHAEGASSLAVGSVSHAEGSATQANGDCSHAEGTDTQANGGYSHAEGGSTRANGNYSHAEGGYSRTNSNYSHAEGRSTQTNGYNSHSEGYFTTADGDNSHAEGNTTFANGEAAHAEGGSTRANADYSHAEGLYTSASSAYQHTQGKYNIEDANNKYAFIIGNGTDNNARSNAFAIDWQGNIYQNNAQSGINIAIALSAKADLENGKIPISQIPSAVIERMVTVADDTARFALTTADVQLGDTVKVISTNKMYMVVDTLHLDSESGYQVYVAGRAAEAVADQNGNTIDTTYETKNDAASIVAIGTCDTAGNVAEKVVTMPQGWTLRTGSIIGVLFSNTNSASGVKLNVAGSGAKSIAVGNGTAGSRDVYCGRAGHYIYYMYDGTNWAWINFNYAYPTVITTSEIDAGTSTAEKVISAQRLKYATDKAASIVAVGTCDTTAATAEKIVTMPQNWTLREGCIIGVLFTNTNTASNVTLNAAGTGAKSIKVSNAVYTGGAGKYCGNANYTIYYMYDGTNWNWISCGALPSPMTQSDVDTGTSNSDKTISPAILKYATDKATENVVGIDSSDDNYIEMKSGLRLYITNTTPTGTIPVGSIGIGF